MSDIRIGAGVSPTPAPGADDAKLRRVAQQLEGVFVEQLFKAMRETVPDGGVVDGGAGEEIFSSMLDQHISTQVPAAWERGLGAAVFRQLRAAVSAAEQPADTSPQVENR